MSSIKNSFWFFIVFNLFVKIQSLVELSTGENNNIVETEFAVRSTVNSIFSNLKLKPDKHKLRFYEFAAIHKFFISITLQDHSVLKKISRLVRVDHIDNKTEHFITQINEVLDEDNKSYEETEDVYVATHIETFIRKLEYLKHKYGFGNNAAGFHINSDVIKHLNPDNNILINVTEAHNTRDSQENLLSDIEFWKPSFNNVTELSGRRIFAGHRAKIKQFPFIASVQFFNKFQCGGSIIKSDLVITAASCLQLAWNNRFFRENPAFLSVQVGCDLYEGGDENIAVLEVYFHPEYNPKNLVNNLAIMRLIRSLKFGAKLKKIKKIDFDRNPWPLPSNTPGITIVGWGAKSSPNIIKNIWSNRLAYSDLDFYPLKECQDVYSKEYVSFRNFCAGFFSKGGGACNRDVGGPGIAHGILIGVISFGAPNCGSPDAPTVFTKLGYYTKWIEGIMAQRVATGRVHTTERTKSFATFGVVDIHRFTAATTEGLLPVIDNTEHESIPITNVDHLRTEDENLLFKEFILTMFGSEEVKEYLDQNEYDTDKSGEAKQVASAKRATRAKVIATTEATAEANIEEQILADYVDKQSYKDPAESVKLVTIIENFDRLESSIEESTDPNVYKTGQFAALQPDMEEESNVENSIAKLIDDIDIEDLLKSDSHEELYENKEASRSPKPKPVVEEEKKALVKSSKSEELVKLNKPEELVELYESEDTTSGDYNEKHSDDPIKSPLNIAYNNNQVREKDSGLSIPLEPFKDITFRQNSSGTGILSMLSQDEFAKLLDEAVVDVTKRI